MMAKFGPEGSAPDDDDGQFNSQEMPATDGELSDATGMPRPRGAVAQADEDAIADPTQGP